MFFLNVGVLLSIATASISGVCFWISDKRAVVKMYAAFVGSPFGLVSCCRIGA